jgi:hypothetical protein
MYNTQIAVVRFYILCVESRLVSVVFILRAPWLEFFVFWA